MAYVDERWWDDDAKDAAERLWAALESCKATDKHRHTDILHRVRMYGNRHYAGLTAGDYNRVQSTRRGRLNVVKAVCDTAINRLSGNRPKPTPLPIAGSNWSLRRKARLLDRFLQGQMRVSRARERMLQALSDAVIAGDGLIKVTEDGSQIVLERTFSGDLSVPPIEARAGAPLTMYQHHFVDRQVLLAMYPGHEKAIKDAEQSRPEGEWYLTRIDKRADQVEVVEGWRLPTTTGGDDGRYVVSVKGAELRNDPWKHDYFPFVRVSWESPYLGFWSDSLVNVVEGQQLEINRLVAKAARANDIAGHVVLFADQSVSNKFNRRKLTNEMLTVVPYVGDMPKFQTIEGLSPVVYQQIESLKAEAFELAGVNHSGGQGIPAGLETGAAVSRWNDLGSVRFRRFSEAFEAAHMDLARQMIDRARDLAEKNGGEFAVPAARDRFSLDRIKWSEVDMTDDQYVLAVYPSSSLPDDAAGRVAAVETLVAAGIVPAERAGQLLNFPDLEGGFLALDRAAYEAAERQVETILDEGKRQHPTPYMDLELALKLAQSHYLNAEGYGVPDERLGLLRAYMDSIKVLLDRRMVEQQRLAIEAGQASGGMRSGVPGAPPATGVAGVAPTAVGAGDGAAGAE